MLHPFRTPNKIKFSYFINSLFFGEADKIRLEMAYKFQKPLQIYNYVDYLNKKTKLISLVFYIVVSNVLLHGSYNITSSIFIY